MKIIQSRPFIWFILPGFLLYSVFVMYPILAAGYISLFKWDGIGEKIFVGFGNYVSFFADEALFKQFLNAFKNSFTLFLLNALVTLPLQLVIAYLIHSKIKGYKFIQTILFSPQLLSAPIIFFMALLMLDVNLGLVNNLLESIGLGSWVRPWLGSVEYGIIVIWVLGLWAGIGVFVLFFVGAMKMINQEIVEAAYIDGSGYWGTFLRIIIPQIKVTITNMFVLTYIIAMTLFEFSYVVGGQAGGVEYSVDVLTLFFYRNTFGSGGSFGGTYNPNQMGMGTTIACLIFVIVFVIAAIQVLMTYRQREAE